MKVGQINFPEYSGVRCLMMPFIQGDPESLPKQYQAYAQIIAENAIEKGKVGFLTIDESEVVSGSPHRAARAQFGRI